MARIRTTLIARLALTAAMVAGGAATISGGSTVSAAADPVLTAVGDTTRCDGTMDDATAALAAAVDGPIAMLGDLVEGKAANEYRDCFATSGWNNLKPRIHAVPGDNGEYGRGYWPNNQGDRKEAFSNAVDCEVTSPCQLDDYYAMFGPEAVGTKEKPYYSYDVGTWHVVAIDVNCSDVDGEQCNGPKTAPMIEWLKADLAQANARCQLVTMHHNFIDVPGNKTAASMRAIMEVLYQHEVDVVLSGHRHTYRRYAPVDINGVEDQAKGIRQFVVGTGGHSRNAGSQAAFQNAAADPNDVLEQSNGDTWGVLRFTAKPGGYDFNFVPAVIQGSSDYSDAGSGTCHGPGVDMAETPATTTPSTQTPPTSGPSTTPTTTAPGTAPVADRRSGYWMVGADGQVYEFGQAGAHGGAVPGAGAEMVDLEPTPSGNGYWLVDSAGRVTVHGDAVNHGGPSGAALAPGEKVTSLSATPSGRGYWIFTNLGKALVFGDAAHLGDMSKTRLNGPVLDSIPTPTGKGYYMVGSDGGIFAFGDAKFYGSMGAAKLNAPVQSLVPDGDGVGYWLVASDGGIFAFEAPFRGSMGSTKLNKPVTGMVPFGNGYLMVGEDGGVFNFSDRDFLGSLGNRPPARPIVSVAVLEG